MSELTIHMFPCLADNYGYLLHDAESGQTAAVDTPDAAEISRRNLPPKAGGSPTS